MEGLDATLAATLDRLEEASARLNETHARARRAFSRFVVALNAYLAGLVAGYLLFVTGVMGHLVLHAGLPCTRLGHSLGLVVSPLVGAALVWLVPMRLPVATRTGRRRLIVPPGLRLRSAVRMMCGRRFAEQVTDQILLDMLHEWTEAMSTRQFGLARWVVVRGYVVA